MQIPRPTDEELTLEAQLLKKAKLLGDKKNRDFKLVEDAWHQRAKGEYVADVVFGANDGIITTFAVVAGAAGASLSPLVVIILGFANLLGDGASMGLGNYLGKKSEAEYIARQRQKEAWEIDHLPVIETHEIREIFERKGFRGADLARAVEIVTSNREVWIDTMMKDELNLVTEPSGMPAKHGLATFIAFNLAGVLPLLPFFLELTNDQRLITSLFVTAFTLFGVGALRTKISATRWWRGGLEMLVVGGVSAALAFGVGWALRQLL